MAIPYLPVVIREDGCPGGGQGVRATHGAVESNKPGDVVGVDQDDATVCRDARRGTGPSLPRRAQFMMKGASALCPTWRTWLDTNKGSANFTDGRLQARHRRIGRVSRTDARTTKPDP
jgi:hypothetical protein